MYLINFYFLLFHSFQFHNISPITTFHLQMKFQEFLAFQNILLSHQYFNFSYFYLFQLSI